jgi:phospholipid/cholesterol/gamma-HCH transport system permease protein
MGSDTIGMEAGLDRGTAGGNARLTARGAWTIDNVAGLESAVDAATAEAGGGRVIVDLSAVRPIDTAGAWLIHRLQAALAEAGASVELVGVSANARRLMDAVEVSGEEPKAPPAKRVTLMAMLEAIGRSTANIGQDLIDGAAILGGVTRGVVRSIMQPSRFRFTSVVFHLDRTGLQAVPIIFLMSLLIGGIIAQQSAFQLRYFGADIYVVDLVGILVLRELGVLLTAIMLAGRSGSAYTAEIGSMKMREEIDALKVIGLDPNEVLIMPRLIALVIALPILTFIADMAALIGGAIVSFTYANIPFETFIYRLRDAVGMNTLNVGLIKAPFMGLIVGLIAANEGLKVQGSAESLGRQTTSSVVKAIFTVIVADGFFAIFFASIDY